MNFTRKQLYWLAFLQIGVGLECSSDWSYYAGRWNGDNSITDRFQLMRAEEFVALVDWSRTREPMNDYRNIFDGTDYEPMRVPVIIGSFVTHKGEVVFWGARDVDFGKFMDAVVSVISET